MIRLLVVSCCLFVVCSSSFAQIADIALKQGIGVRAAGMGGAHVAVADDGSATFYNPAALADAGFAYTYGDPDTGEKNVTGSFELLKLGYIGYGAWRLKDASSDEVSVSSLGFGNRSGWLNWGMSYKAVESTLSGVNDKGWASDLGFLMRVSPEIKIGACFQDILTSKTSLAPASLRLGAAWQPLSGRVTLASDIEIYHTTQTFGHFGLEVNVLPGLATRVGVDRGLPTAGLTLDLAVFSFDYAAAFSRAGVTTQRFEAGLKILPKKQRPFSIIKPKEYALIDVTGAIKGGRTEYSFLGGMKPGLDSILTQIRKAAKDSSIDGIMLKIGGFDGGLGGMAIVQELRDELQLARKSGKKIVAYVEGSAVGDEYYLAAIADKIVAPPGAAIGGFGKGIGVYRLKGLYKKIGLDWQVFKQGKYKDAFDPGRSGFSQEQEEMTRGIVADLYRQMLTDIAKDRKLKLDKVKEIGDGMIFPAKLAKQMGLIDEVGYYKDSRLLAATLCGEKDKEAKIVEPEQVVPEEVFFTRVFGVAVIEIDGEIVSGAGGENVIFGGRYVGAETVVDYIKQASDDIFVKAIILRINSPGGDAVASGEIYNALEYARKKDKKIIASIGSVAASGGYYIACAADKIVADPASLTGSIGVIGHLPLIYGLLEKLDIETDVIKEGKHADMFFGLRKLTSVEVMAVERLQQESYHEFIRAVAQGRKMTEASVEAVAEGRLYTGSEALEEKLIDATGSFAAAIDLAKKEAAILGEPRLIFYHQPSLFFSFGNGVVESLGLQALNLWPLLKPGYN